MTDEVATYRDWISKQWGLPSRPEPSCNGESRAVATAVPRGVTRGRHVSPPRPSQETASP